MLRRLCSSWNDFPNQHHHLEEALLLKDCGSALRRIVWSLSLRQEHPVLCTVVDQASWLEWRMREGLLGVGLALGLSKISVIASNFPLHRLW